MQVKSRAKKLKIKRQFSPPLLQNRYDFFSIESFY